jgi:hypothetical protein
VLRQQFRNLVIERGRKVIFLGSLVEHPVADAHPPTGDYPLRYELVPLILDYGHFFPFLGPLELG